MSTKQKNERAIQLEALEKAAEALRVLAHKHRLLMVQLLLQGEHAVGEVADASGIPRNTASEHLKLLKSYRGLKAKKDGRSVCYSVVDRRQLAKIRAFIELRLDMSAE